MNKQDTVRKVYLKTFGCQMNVRDAEVIAGLLRATSYELTTKPDEADIVIFNTCSVRQHAEDKVWSELGKFKVQSSKFKVKKTKNKPLIGVIGCMAQNYKEKIFERAPQVDFVVGPSDIQKIPDILNQFKVQSSKFKVNSLMERKIWETDGETRPEEIYHSGFYEDKEHVYVVISEGCSNFCSYCVVPYVRGQIHHRDDSAILREIEEAVARGITKVTLLGQNVCAYGAETRNQSTETRTRVNFVKLLELVNNIKGLREFSFITSHPKDTTVELFKAMANLDKLKKYLHLPVQSGSNRVLMLMNRGYNKKYYLDLAEDYRKMIPGGALTTDIIVGYPSETEEDFQETHDLVKKAQFNSAFIFKYSVRPGTKAAQAPEDVPQKEKERRHRIILELQKKISRGKK